MGILLIHIHYLHIYENHDEPYHFTPQKYRMGLLDDGEVKSWEERVSLRSIPLLFPIVEPRCLSVDSVSVEADSTGCAWARWDSLPRQERWVVQYRSAGGVGGIDTVDAPEWRRCGLTQGERYEVRVGDDIAGYMMDLVEATRRSELLLSGVSTRGSLALYRACQIFAALQGRDYVIPEDVKREAVWVLPHRLTLVNQSHLDSVRFLENLLDEIPVPLEKL